MIYITARQIIYYDKIRKTHLVLFWSFLTYACSHEIILFVQFQNEFTMFNIIMLCITIDILLCNYNIIKFDCIYTPAIMSCECHKRAMNVLIQNTLEH